MDKKQLEALMNEFIASGGKVKQIKTAERPWLFKRVTKVSNRAMTQGLRGKRSNIGESKY